MAPTCTLENITTWGAIKSRLDFEYAIARDAVQWDCDIDGAAGMVVPETSIIRGGRSGGGLTKHADEVKKYAQRKRESI